MMTKIKRSEALFAQGKIEQANEILSEIIANDPKNKDALNNLGVIAFQRGDLEEAIEFFTRTLEIDPFHRDAILNFSDLLKSVNRFGESIPVLENGVAKFPRDEEMNRLLNEALQTLGFKPKIAVMCLPGLESFLGDIVDFLRTRGDVRTCYSANSQEIESAIHWADIVWLEWANELAIHVTNKVPAVSEKQVICRIHSYEVLSGYLPHIDWSKISKTIFVADHVLNIALEVCPSISYLTKAVVIHNGVNLEKFPFAERSPGFNIGVVGRISHKKNPCMWIEVLNRLMKIDKRYTLKVAGPFQELRYKYYMESIIPKLGLTKNIEFFGQVDEISKWFETNEINYLLTTSPFESFGYAMAEAMAMGYRPLIHAFPSAEQIWPTDCVFGCIDDLLQSIRDRENYDSRKYREFVEKKYSLQSQLEKIEGLVKEMADEISSEATFSERRCRSEAHKQWNIPAALAKYHRPDKTVIVTGIPRSGTSLFSALLNDLDNAVCLNEILYDVNSLPSALAEIRRRLIAGEPIPNRYDSSGNLATDTQGSGANVEERVIQDVDENAVIGSKVNIPYLNQIEKILDYGYKVIALVRDPVYTIASWNSEKASIIPEAHVADEDMHPRWRSFRFKGDNKIERQAQIWQHYADLLWKLRNTIKIIRYTELTDNTYEVMQYVCEYFGLKNSTTQSLKNMNVPSRFANLDMILQAVMKHCPMANTLGYYYLEDLHSGHRASANGKIGMAAKPSVKEEFRESNVGPFVIFGRGHCGGRALCEAYTRNGIFMGKTTAERMDTVGFGLDNSEMLHILKHAFSYPSLPKEKQAQLEGIVMEMVSKLASKAGGKPFGWKHGISVFCIEMLLRTCPEARVVHLIRDGRDVMLSRLPARLNPDAIEQEHNKLAVFGAVDVNSYKGLPLPIAVQDERLRNELEMIHWKTATEFGLRGRRFANQYKEVKYEALCQHPVGTLTEIFGFLGLPLRQETVNWAEEFIHPRRIGKWKSRVEDLTEAIALGEPLLSHLGYTGE